MEKTAFKTFVFSFIFSLFAFFCINRVFFCTPKKNIENLKISNKNITLFLKSNDFAPIHVASAPIQKITLSTVKDIPSPQMPIKDEESLASNVDEKNVSPNTIEEEIIPLEDFSVVKQNVEPKNNLSNEEKTQTNKEVILAAADIPLVKNDTVHKKVSDFESKKVVYSPQKEIAPIQAEAKDILLPIEKEQNLLTLSPSQETKKEVKKENNILAAEDNSHAESETLLAQTQEKTQEPLMLIPLENPSEKLLAKASIKKAADAERSQVALASKETPIHSMETKSIVKEDTKKDSSSKNWESMKDKHAQKKDEDPWIVAKGNNFPNNQFLKDKKYTISNDEVQKIFKERNLDATNTEDVQLASKTVKNLLIPIPEDILNDENLTPQLVSSPKNKEIQEELEAKGLIKKEETSEETDTQISTQSTVQEEKQNSSEAGILDSITSLFGTNKDNGNNSAQAESFDEDDEEDSSSLFSVFNKKQSKLISKILPTEIRLSFQPNRAEISGQTLRWIKAFAQKTAEEPSTGLEIRIDGTSSPLLQRRRLNLLQNILLNEGAPAAKINTVFTAREPNSLVLRTIRLQVNQENIPAKNNNRYMQW